MAILDRSKKQKVAMRIILIYGFIALGILALLLITLNHRMAKIDTNVTGYVELGTMRLIKIQRIPAKIGGYNASITLLPALFYYIGIWLVMTAITITFKFKSNYKLTDNI